MGRGETEEAQGKEGIAKNLSFPGTVCGEDCRSKSPEKPHPIPPPALGNMVSPQQLAQHSKRVLLETA